MTTNKQRFLDEFSLLDRAACGLILVRTKEPLRADEAIRTWCYGQEPKRPFRRWSMVSGLVSYSIEDSLAPPQVVPNFAALDIVLRGIGGFPSPTGSTAPQSNTGRDNRNQPFANQAIFSFVWPHSLLVKTQPVIMALLNDLAPVVGDVDQRLIFIVPQSYEIPDELSTIVTVLDFLPPSKDEHLHTYDIVANASNTPLVMSDSDQKVVLNALAGMTEAEAGDALARAMTSNRSLLPNIPIDKFLPKINEVRTEAIRRSDCLEALPPVSISNLGGLDLLKEWVSLRKFSFGHAAREAGVDKPRGVMLIGVSGSGKSLAAKVIAAELQQSLVKFDLSRVYAGLVGASEAKVRGALKTLESIQPAVVLIDELDKAVSTGHSGGNDGGVATRVLGTLLNFMQESEAEIFWVFTANRTGNLPSELVRKGRLDEVFCVTMPSASERLEILKIHLRKRKIDPTKITGLEEFAESSAGYVGAELEQAVSAAKLVSYANKIDVTAKLLDDQLRSSKPLSEAFAEDFKAMQDWAEQNARPASSTQNTGGQPAARQRVRSAPSRNLKFEPNDASSRFDS